ncbi:DUF2238 domain-containing protein [Sinisalibacter aestuarii]|uniref:DUF2238 domain-containing protein n=1 Tax=Sinisalibacter aestuarii TaxID=2949426 RepID=A0ABQ5LT82_9RHOB|nr:DUF2238 domain-containing protein [Sinisalibacter aestuarii]GKY87531.1 hypothetical protein STA1M1_14000 [Sinisalibacter aestuarii]
MSFLASIKPAEKLVAGFVILYLALFSAWFFSIGNNEFIIYIVTMLVLMALIGATLRVGEYPAPMLWALALWGLLHCAGGGVPVGDQVLYAVQILPILGNGDSEMTLLKYDQIVHALGFGITAWVLWHVLTRHYPETRRSWTAYAFPALASMGLGAVNEIIEFSAVVIVQDTGVGGYLNTALDLCFNGAGALIAVMIIARTERIRG